MAITLEAIRAAGGIVHSDGNIFFRDISMLQGLAGAAPALEAPAAPAPAVPDGWRLVPANPTDAMLGAAQKAWLADPLRRSSTLYVAALAAAPQVPAQEAPAGPAGDDDAEYKQWFQSEQGKPYQGMWEFARAAWMARAALAAAPQVPAQEAPAGPVQHQGMTIAGNGAAELGKLMREQRGSRLGVYPDGNPNSGQP